jgi:hypothetical protein
MAPTLAAQQELHDDHELEVAPAVYVQGKLMKLKNKLRLLPGELTQEQKRVISDVVGKKVVTKTGARNALVSLCGVLQVSNRYLAGPGPSWRPGQSGCAIVGGLRTSLNSYFYQVNDRSSETIGALQSMSVGELQSISDKLERVRGVLGMMPDRAPAGIWAVQSPPHCLAGA